MENVLKRDVIDDISSSYLEYALDVIIGRALPDVRDGCKPVHRRILYSAWDTNNVFTQPHKKSARTVGEVLGKYHPHGDTSVYDAMVRLAQPFSMRYPFIDGHGNFGSVDGDPAAAMRYTEARMSKISALMMEDIDKNTVDMMKNYDATLDEPTVLPAKLPNLLINGTEGIAVGFASKIPPHNLTEAMNGIIATIDNPDITVEELMKYIKAPDFPCGGIIMGLDGVRDAYKTGKGSIVIRSRYNIEPIKNTQRQQIVFTEIPYQVNKSDLVAKINELSDEKIEGIHEVRDESSVREGTGIRIVIELDKNANSDRVLRQLFKQTDLQTKFPANLRAVVPAANGKLVPRLLNLKDIVKYFIAHRKEVVTRKYQFLLNKAEARNHILEGLIKAVSIIDDIVATIRKSKSKEDAKSDLIQKFDFSDAQATAILQFQLQRLVGLEIEKIENEKKEVEENIKNYKNILSSDENVMKEVRKDCEDVLNQFGDERRTEIVAKANEEIDDNDVEQMMANAELQDVVLTFTDSGYVKRVPLEAYNTQSRGGQGVKNIKNVDLDIITKIITTDTQKMLLCFGSDGKMYKLPVINVPEDSKTGRGKFLNNLIGANGDVKIIAVMDINPANKNEGFILMFSKLGGVKKIAISDLITSRKSVTAINLKNEDDSLINVCHVFSNEKVYAATRNGKIICFGHENLTAHGRAAGTMKAIKLANGDYVVGANILKENEYVLTVTNTGMGKKASVGDYRIQTRGGTGTLNYKTNKDTYVVAVININDQNDILTVCDNGKIIRVNSTDIRATGRVAKGVRIVKLKDNENVLCVTASVKTEEKE